MASDAEIESALAHFRACLSAADARAHFVNLAVVDVKLVVTALAAARERIAELEAALKEACDEYEYAVQYKSDYLAMKHEDMKTIARLRAALPGDGPDAKVPDLLLDVECPHNPTVYSTSGVAGVPIPCEVRPRDCDDCIRLALSAAADDARREALAALKRECANVTVHQNDVGTHLGWLYERVIRALSGGAKEESR